MEMVGKDATDCGCGNFSLNTDAGSGEKFCGNCGIVISQGEDVNQFGTKMFDDGDDKRHHAPLSGPRKYSPGTEIGFKDVHGRGVDKEVNISGIKMQQRSTRNDVKFRNLRNAMPMVDRIFDKLGVKDESVRDQTAILYKKVMKAGLVRGRQIDVVTASCAYASMKEHGVHYGIKDICKAVNLKKKDVFRVYSDIVKRSDDIGNGLKNIYKTTDDIAPYSSRISRFVSALPGLDDRLKTRVERDSIGLVAYLAGHREGKSYDGESAAAVYKTILDNKDGYLNGYSVTQEDLANISKITEVTIRNRLKDMDAYLRKRAKSK